jgi:hypothetical protein
MMVFDDTSKARAFNDRAEDVGFVLRTMVHCR